MLKLKFKKYMNERNEELKKIIISDGLHLVEAPTGAGKTTAVKECFKELSKLHKDRVFIIACPNRVQNLQNEDAEITAIVGGKTIDSVIIKSSMVYDKATDILKAFDKFEEYKITLIVDEAHQLIYSKNFRKKAIKDLLELSNKCDTVIHLTATATALKDAYKYDSMYQFEPVEQINNIDSFKIIKSENNINTLFKVTNELLSKDKKILVFYDNKLKASEIQKKLQETYKNKKFGLITSDDKEKNDIFNSIVKESQIPTNYDVVIATSVLECGTNILNAGYVPVVFLDSNKYFSVTATVQKIARLRNKVDEGYLILSKPSREKELLFIEKADLIEQELTELNDAMNSINAFINIPRNIEDGIYGAKALLKEKNSRMQEVCKGILYFDEMDKLVKFDIEAFYRMINNKYDLLLVDDNKKLLEAFKGNIKANTITVIEEVENKTELKEVQALKQDLKEIKSTIKEQKEELRKSIIDNLEDTTNRDLIGNYLTACKDDKELYLYGFTNDLRELISKAEKDHPKILDEFKKVFKDNIEICGINSIIENNFDNESLKKYRWLFFNNLKDMDKIKIDCRYKRYRDWLDNRIQKKLSKKYLNDLYQYVNKTKKEPTPKARDRLIEEINLIYNISSVETYKNKYDIVSSLKKE